MNQLNETDAEKILSAVRIGLWRVEFEEGKPTRFYADAVMDELLGVTGDVTPGVHLDKDTTSIPR